MNARRRNRSHRHQHNPDRSDGAGDGKSAQTETQGLRHGADEIDGIVANECQDRARAENESEGDDRRGDDDGTADVAGGRARFARENRDILESAQPADGEFAEDVEAIKDRQGGRGDLERVILLQVAARESDEGQSNQGAVDQKHGESADVVDPFA